MSEFQMTDAAAISMTNRGPGPGAKVTITADHFFMEGTGEGFPAIFANSAQQGGDAASIDITVSGAMILSNLATISASALQDSAGQAGNIVISAESLTLFAGAEIFSQSFGVGGGGNIELVLGSELQLFASSISTQQPGLGNHDLPACVQQWRYVLCFDATGLWQRRAGPQPHHQPVGGILQRLTG